MSENPVPDSSWTRHSIPSIGLSLAVYRPWAFETVDLKDGQNLYQRIPGGGLAFLRFGEAETLEAFLPTLEDYVTRATILDDREINFLGQPARLVILRQVKQAMGVYMRQAKGAPLHKMQPEQHTLVSVISFKPRGIPVLVGYRLPEEKLPEVKEILDQFMTLLVPMPSEPNA